MSENTSKKMPSNGHLKVYENDKIKLKKLKDQIYNEEAFKRKVAEKIKATATYRRPTRNNSILEQQFRLTSSREKAKLEFILKPNYITTERHSSLVDLKCLKRVCLNEMFVNKIHYGYYFECKTVADPFYISGMHLLVSDNNGDLENLILYNFESKSYDVDPKMIIPPGTKLIIKEPHLQLFGLDETNFGIRVDSPSDIYIVSYAESELHKTSEDCIDAGNKMFAKRNFHAAIKYYSQAIEKSNEMTSRAFLNRSQCYIKLEKYYSAYHDARKAVSLDVNNEKAHFRMGKSAYLMRKFDLALESFEACIKLNPKNAECVSEIRKTNERINESKNGSYDFQKLYAEFFLRENLLMDIADYKTSKIAVVDIKNKSKGVIATECIKKGTLLAVSKAVSAVFHNKIDYRKKSCNTVYFCANSYNTKNETENISDIVYKMYDDPYLADQIYTLYAGPEFNRDKLEHPMIDIKRVEAIYGFNSFQIKNAYESLEIIEMEKEIKKLENYDEDDFAELDLASVDFESEAYQKLAKFQTKFNNLNKQCGLWFFSAFFNHSCISNVILTTIGDVMLFYSQRDIAKDEELTIRYFPPEWAYTDKIDRAMQMYGFKCDCVLCKLDEKDPMRKVREQLLQEIESKHSSANKISISEALTNVNKMRHTYLKRPEYQLQLVEPIQILASKYRDNFDHKKAAKCMDELFELIKDYNDFVAITMLKDQLSDYKKCSNTKKIEACKKLAFDYFDSIHLHPFYYEKLWNKFFKFQIENYF